MTPTEQLRRASETLLRLADGATPGPWHPATTGVECGDHWSVIDYPTMNPVCRIPSQDGENEDQREPDARFIALMDPDLARLLADLLDAIAASQITALTARHALALAEHINERASNG